MSDRRKFTLEFKIEAAHRVIDSGRSAADVARELSLNSDTLRGWVSDERRRIQAAADVGQEPLSAAEHVELIALRKQVSELEKDLDFLGKAAAYFAANPPKRTSSR